MKSLPPSGVGPCRVRMIEKSAKPLPSVSPWTSQPVPLRSSARSSPGSVAERAGADPGEGLVAAGDGVGVDPAEVDLVGARREVEDLVEASSCCNSAVEIVAEDVRSAVAGQQVRAEIAVQEVGLAAALQGVRRLAAEDVEDAVALEASVEDHRLVGLEQGPETVRVTPAARWLSASLIL